MIEHVQPEGLPEAVGFTQVVVAQARRLAFVAGQGPFGAQHEIVGGGDFGAQVRQAFRNLRTALVAVGSAPELVVSATFYVVGLDAARVREFVAAMNDALDGRPFPPTASSLIGCTRLGVEGMLVEISATAVVPD